MPQPASKDMPLDHGFSALARPTFRAGELEEFLLWGADLRREEVQQRAWLCSLDAGPLALPLPLPVMRPKASRHYQRPGCGKHKTIST